MPKLRVVFEMEPNHSDDDNAMEGLVESPYLHGINGEPQLLPRVGDQYQAVIPLLVPEHDRLNLIRYSGSDPHMGTFGLPIPLMWTRSEKFRGFLEAEIEEEEEGEKRPSCHVSLKPRSLVLALPCQKNSKLKFEWLDKSLYPFPGTLGESWEDAERERFLLGLYFLGKNLVLLQRFVGSKKMGDMLSYYYGSFYRSNEYKRWVDGRKSGKSKRSVQGHKLLTGWRQQELLSRISSHVSEECKSTLLQVYKAFREDRIELEEYVFTLKKLIGLDMLTEAIGIGKGKKDLTLESTKLNNPGGASKVRIRNDLPVADIVKFLTGEYRMSKTRSSDLFWEAVWPRLLARGWHSEQPKDGPKNSLVFLIPEANKFSRRKMSKGNHYFDSLTDVLNKVALDPTLLDLSTDEDPRGSRKEEEIKNEPAIDIEESDDDDSSQNKKKKKKRYLEPRIKTSKSQEATMYTIVDTSGVEEGCCRLKELRSLPIETGNSSYLSESKDHQLSEESENKAETTTAFRVCGGGSISSGKSNSVDMDNTSTISLNERVQKNRKRGRPRNPKSLPNLADCAQYGKKKPVKKGTKMRPNPSEANQNVVFMTEEHTDQDQTLKLSSTGSSAEDSSCGRSEGRQERPEIREDFDLNVSQISLEAEDTVITEGVHNSAQQSSIQMDEELPQEVHVSGPGRRQSTRTRPLTAKALEAFAFGYLGNSEQKRKSTDEPRRRKYTKRIRKEKQALNQEESSS